MTTVLLTGAGGSASANFEDALLRSGSSYRIVGADSSPVRLHLSKATARYLIPEASDPGYIRALCALAAETGAEVLHPQPDAEVLAIGAAREVLSISTYLPSQHALETASDKFAFADKMGSSGIPVPDSIAFSDMDSMHLGTKEFLQVHDRAWIRARRGAGARASLPVRSVEQASAWISWWVDEKGLMPSDFMAAEYLPGREFAYQSIWQDGELIAGQARERVEYLYGHLTPHGQTSTPSVARTVDIPEVDSLAIAAIRALDTRPCGAYCVDIKEAADGPVKVTEINAGRFFTTSNFFAAAGLNMPEMLVRCALGERLPSIGTSPLEPDLYWIRMVDMGYALVPGHELNAWPCPHP